MATTKPSLRLTHEGALKALAGAVAKAEELGVAQNITIVDDGGNLLAFVRMDGAKLLSRETSMSKAITAASHRQPTSRLNPADEIKLAIAGGGRLDQSRRRTAHRDCWPMRRRGRRWVGHRRAGCRSRACRAGSHRRGGSEAMSDKIELFYAPTSPYVRKVMACAIELGFADRIVRLPERGASAQAGRADRKFQPAGQGAGGEAGGWHAAVRQPGDLRISRRPRTRFAVSARRRSAGRCSPSRRSETACSMRRC